MTKLLSTLIAASMFGALSLSAVAADAPAADPAATAEKPADAPHKADHHKAKKTELHKAKKADKPAEPAAGSGPAKQ